jgi:hypothetical protein
VRQLIDRRKRNLAHYTQFQTCRSFVTNDCEARVLPPDVKLADARRLARDAREAISKGRDPVEDRRAAKAKLLAEAGRLPTFEQACRDYLAAHEKT